MCDRALIVGSKGWGLTDGNVVVIGVFPALKAPGRRGRGTGRRGDAGEIVGEWRFGRLDGGGVGRSRFGEEDLQAMRLS